MGVKGLWQLLSPIGRRISIETLEGKVLAIDASIWLTQFISVTQSMQDRDDDDDNTITRQIPSALYLIGVLRRLCKLRFHGIRPVLVFDGLTPEIKQRELRERRRRRKRKNGDTFLLGGEDDEDNAQRLAKRILAKQLKKRKVDGKLVLATTMSTATQSQQDEKPSYNDKQEENNDQTQTENKKGSQNNTAVEKEKSDDDNNVVVDDDYDDEYLPPSEQDGQDYDDDDDNDWNKVDRLSKEENDRLDKSESNKGDDDDNNNNNNNNRQFFHRGHRRNKKKRTDSGIHDPSIYHGGDGTSLAIDQVARLNADQRKDIIQDAQKHRYLQSRGEFLQVAYNPQLLSSCQLRNFLKSTRLNKDIHAMAKKATKLEEQEQRKAKRTTTTTTNTIIFEKDDENDDTANSKRPTAKQKQQQQLRHYSDDDDDSDDNDNMDWQDGTTANPSLRGDSYFRKAIVDDEDNNSHEINNDDGSYDSNTHKYHEPTEGGFFVPISSNNINSKQSANSSKDMPIKSRKIRILDDENDANENDEVISIPSDMDTKLPAKADEVIAQEMQDEALARAIYEAENDDVNDHHDDGGGGGGFIPTNSLPVQRHDGLQESGGFLTKNKDIQPFQSSHVDYESGGGFLSSEFTTQQSPLRNEKEYGVDVVLRKSDNIAATTNKNSMSDVDSGRHDPSSQLNTEGTRTVITDHMSKTIQSDEDDNVDWEDGEEEEDRNTGSSVVRMDRDNAQKTLNTKKSAGETKEEPDDENVDWEDGNSDSVDLAKEATSSPSSELKKEEILVSDTRVFSSKGQGLPPDEGAEEDILSDNSETHGTFQVDEWGQVSTIKKGSSEMADALEHAQTTAANLTNWAGRAFRMAVAQHAAEQGMEVPQVVKRSAFKNDEFTPKEDDNMVPQDAISEERTEHYKDTQVESTVRNAKRELADNSRWLETIDTTTENTNEDTEGGFIHHSIGGDNDMDPASGGVTEEMRAEVMQLLSLFGIPYVVAPTEAEAQCVELEKLGLVDGVVTEDSDAFVFGGQVVYKNIFDDKKYVEVYHAKDAVEKMNVNRDAFVALAMLLGGDYTEGVKGVGIVNGMEVLDGFDVANDCRDGLRRFRKWLDGFNPADLARKDVRTADPDVTSKEQSFHKAHRSARNRWIAPKYFPDEKVLNAYLNPVVDTSRERFSWGVPDLNGLQVFCKKYMGWPVEETKKVIDPVIARLYEGTMRQTRIDSFMRYEDGITFASIRSKRLQNVLESKFGNSVGSGNMSEENERSTEVEKQRENPTED